MRPATREDTQPYKQVGFALSSARAVPTGDVWHGVIFNLKTAASAETGVVPQKVALCAKAVSVNHNCWATGENSCIASHPQGAKLQV